MRYVATLFCLALLVAIGLCAAAPAHAHGGAFREDGGPPPPPPDPPAPPPAIKRAPITGGVPRPPSSPLPTTPRARSYKAHSPTAWRHWWSLHADELLPPAGTSTRRDPVTGSVEAPRAGTLRQSDWQQEKQLSERIVRSIVEPFLGRLARKDDLRPVELAATLIAWARCASEPPELPLFFERALSSAQRLEVRESAVLALGMLRRSDPRLRFPVSYLDGVRRFLEDSAADEKQSLSVRVFAVLSLALLGDQPIAPRDPQEANRTTRALWRHVVNPKAHYALQHAAMVAIGMQPTIAVPADVRDLLQRIARGRNVLRRRWDGHARAHALATLARLEHPDWRTIAKVIVRSQHVEDVTKYTAIELLGRAASAMPRWEREDVGKLLRHAARARQTPNPIRGELLITLGRLFAVAASDPEADREELRRMRQVLHTQMKKAKLHVRPFAAIGLGLGVRDMSTEDLSRHELARDIRRSLVDEAPVARGSDEAVAAYALACGLAQADQAAPWLMEQLDDVNTRPTLRAHCALALGLLGRAYKPIRDSLRRAALDRQSSRIHLYAVRALAMLGQKNVPPLLTRRLEQTRSLGARRTLVLGLARSARAEVFAPLLLIVSDRRNRPSSTTSVAIASLGVLSDPEPRPSRVRLVPSINRYLVSPPMLAFLNVL